MARITKINSLEKALKVAGGQITAQQLLNERMYLKTTSKITLVRLPLILVVLKM